MFLFFVFQTVLLFGPLFILHVLHDVRGGKYFGSVDGGLCVRALLTFGFGVFSCAAASDILIGLTAQVNWKPLLVALGSEEEWIACALPRPVTVV